MSYLKNENYGKVIDILQKMREVFSDYDCIEIYQKFRRAKVKSEMYAKYDKIAVDILARSEYSQVYTMSDDEEVKGFKH